MPITADLVAAVQAFNDVHRAWADSPGKDPPPAEYWYALDALIETFAGISEMPNECFPLQRAVNNLSVALAEFDASGSPTPGDGFWTAREALEIALRNSNVAATLAPLESIQQLHDEKVHHEQIARMYGFVDRDGKGKAHVVAKELARPGSAVDWSKWVDPRLKDYGGQAPPPGNGEIGYVPPVLLGGSVAGAPGVPGGSPAPACPESSEDLFLQKVSVQQAAKMLGRTAHDVAAEWRGFEAKYARSTQEVAIERAQKQIAELDGLPADNSNHHKPAGDGFVSPEPSAEDRDEFAGMSDDDLREECKRRGVGFSPSTKRKALLSKLRQATAEPAFAQ